MHELLRELKQDDKIYEYDTLSRMGYNMATQLFTQILEGVNYLHEQNPQIIHRNLSVYNILILNNYQSKSVVKIAGLGSACLHKEKGQKHTQYIGSASTMAPEVEDGTQYDTRADIYSLEEVLREKFLIDEDRY